MKNVEKKMLKSMLKIAILCFLVLCVLKLKLDQVAQLLVYSISLLLIPFCIRSTELSLSKKSIYVFLICSIGSVILMFFNGIGRVLYIYIIVISIIIFSVIIIKYSKKIL